MTLKEFLEGQVTTFRLQSMEETLDATSRRDARLVKLVYGNILDMVLDQGDETHCVTLKDYPLKEDIHASHQGE